MAPITFSTSTTPISTWRQIYNSQVSIRITNDAVDAIKASRKTVEIIIADENPVYGINTGFGSLSHKSIPASDLNELQSNLVKQLCVGAGKPFATAIVRLAMALKVASLAKGYSGVRLELVERLILFLDEGINPVVPEKGSVGASGDLAPLAHISAALIGFGDVEFAGQVTSAEEAHRRLGISPLVLQAKEGLAMVNGTQVSTALALAALLQIETAFETAVVVGSLTTEAALGLEEAFDPRIHSLRRHRGQTNVAATVKRLISGSQFRAPSLQTGKRQDPYSIRCQPQVLGPILEILAHCRETLTQEADAVTDNPLVFADTGEVLSGGNFHAEPVAFAADTLALAICEIGSLSERRLALLTDAAISGLPPFLTSGPGLHSGFMPVQIAAAALVAENRQKAHPSVTDNVPTVANLEDFVSMATHGARRLLDMVDTLNEILTFELLAALEGCDHRGYQLGPELEAVRKRVRDEIPRMSMDRHIAPDLQRARKLVKDRVVVDAAGLEMFDSRNS